MINVTKTFLPSIEDYHLQLKRIWQNEWLTNRGPLVTELEYKIKEELSLEKSKIILMNNGTLPLQIALKLLGNGGEIITTPFSYVATTAAILWENCTPVFVDIHPDFLTIDESKIEAAITEKTTCILATHVFGIPCNIEEIERIANRNNLKVIYDAAHCFGVTYKGKSIFEYGDVSTCSFHATKLFHTGEGGAFFTKDSEIYRKAFYSHNFGHNGQLEFSGLGINGKMSELQAAMGLCVLPNIANIVDGRREIVEFYKCQLTSNNISIPLIRENTVWNFSYFPVLMQTEELLLKIQKVLNENDINPRRYFYPSLNTINFVSGDYMPVSNDISSRILCLPLYYGLDKIDLKRIIMLINANIDA